MLGSDSTQWRRQYIAALSIISLAILASPVAIDLLTFLPDTVRAVVRRSFNLAYENNVGAWWCGSLLFLGGLHALDGYQHHNNAGPVNLGRAWLVIAAILIALSLDEVGSLHERIDHLPFNTWWYFLAFGGIIIASLTWALRQIWADPTQRRSVIAIVIAFTCFASVAGQEYLEHSVEWPPRLVPFRTGVEEGTELVGMLLLVWATMRNSGGVFEDAETDVAARPILWLTHSMPVWVLLSIVVAVPLFAAATAILPDQSRGHPADWLAAMLFLVVALSFWRNVLIREPKPHSNSFGYAVIFLVASAVCVDIRPSQMGSLAGLTINYRLAILSALLFGAAAFAWLRESPAKRRSAYKWLIAACFTSLSALASNTLMAVYLLTSSVAVFSYCFAVPSVTAEMGRLLLGLGYRNRAAKDQ